MSRRAIVLVGHDVYEGAPSPTSAEAEIAISVEELQSTVAVVASLGYEFVGIAEFLARWREGGVALLTFDDGYRSVADVAFPVLRAQGVPFGIFVISQSLVGATPFPFWLYALRDSRNKLAAEWEMLTSLPLFSRATGGQSLTEMLSGPLPVVVSTFLKRYSHEELRRLGDEVTGRAPELNVVLGPGELDRLTASGMVELGAHSVSHRSFSGLSGSELEAEIRDSVAAVAAFTGRRASETPFAYPYGQRTCEAERIVRQHAGAGFTTSARPVSRFDAVSALPRMTLDRRSVERLKGLPGGDAPLTVMAEALQVHLRTGPAWKVIGPLHRLFKPKTVLGDDLDCVQP